MLGFATAVLVDQAELEPAAGLRGRTLDTRAGKSSSWKEEFFFGWAEYAGVMRDGTAAVDKLGKSSSFKAARAAGTTAGADLTLEGDTQQEKFNISAHISV